MILKQEDKSSLANSYKHVELSLRNLICIRFKQNKSNLVHMLRFLRFQMLTLDLKASTSSDTTSPSPALLRLQTSERGLGATSFRRAPTLSSRARSPRTRREIFC